MPKGKGMYGFKKSRSKKKKVRRQEIVKRK